MICLLLCVSVVFWISEDGVLIFRLVLCVWVIVVWFIVCCIGFVGLVSVVLVWLWFVLLVVILWFWICVLVCVGVVGWLFWVVVVWLVVKVVVGCGWFRWCSGCWSFIGILVGCWWWCIIVRMVGLVWLVGVGGCVVLVCCWLWLD